MSDHINIVISTGAGISAESGVPTYRDTDGLWTKFNPAEVSHINGWIKEPQKVLDFKNLLRREFVAKQPKPNAAHHALTRLQKQWTHGRVTIVTQNIDGLHVDAGSDVFEMHGTARKKFCGKCGHTSAFDADIFVSDPCEKCAATGTTRPLVVLFGEMPMYLDQIQDALDDCQIFAAIGTSGVVRPACDFVDIASTNDTHWFNTEENMFSYAEQHLGLASVTVPEWVDELLRDQ